MSRPQLLACLLLTLTCCTVAQGEPTTLTRYDYQHMARDIPFRTCTVDAGDHAGVGQVITVPPDAKDVCGVRFKVSKAGHPGPLLYKLGTTPGGAEIAAGAVPSEEIIALYDLFYGGDFTPQAVKSGEKLYLTLRAERGNYPDDYYLAYGPRDGEGIPEKACGTAIAPKGHEAFPLSYCLLTSVGPGDPPGVEERFEFVRRITRPPYADATLLRDPKRKAGPDEVAIDSEWSIIGPPEGNAVIDTAIGDLQTYFDRAMGIKLPVRRRKTIADASRQEKTIVVGDVTTLSDQAEGLKGSESYRVVVKPDRIILCGADDRGAMRAIYHLEDVTGFAEGPFVKRGSVTKKCLFSPRLTQRIGPSNSFLTEFSQPNIYTDGFLSTISHQGFNAVYAYANLEEFTHDSEFFPELNNALAPRKYGDDAVFPEVKDEKATDRRYRRLRDLVSRGKKYGIDVYLYYATNYHHSVPKSLYEKYPDCQGYSWGNSMCTSNPRVQEYFAETTRHIFQRVPGLKGLVLIFDSEGFFSCARSRSRCPRCKDRLPEDIVTEYITTINKAMKQVDPRTELIAWSYYTGHPAWVVRGIPKLPKDVTFQPGFAKGSIVERGGVRHVAGDYIISEIGPPKHFVEHAEVAIASGLKLSAKTSHSYANEFVNVPYIPVPQQFHRRIAAMREYPISAFLANWTHHGYSPNLNAEMLKWYYWNNEPEIDRLLLNLASRQFGAEAAPGFVEAWSHFSKAITYYPYSDGVARYPGPIQVGPGQPLYLDRSVRGAGGVRSWQNDLKWTKPWGPDIVLKYFGLLQSEWQRGLDVMEKAMAEVPPNKQQAARREHGIAKSILCCVRSCMNVVRFLQARNQLYAEADKVKRDEILKAMREIAETELANAREALVLCQFDSRIGYASGGARVGGLYTPALIRWKIDQVEEMIRDEMPRFAATYQPPPSVKPQIDSEAFAKMFDVAAVGGATCTIKDGRLSMRSPSPAGGINLNYRERLRAPRTFEVTVDTAGMSETGLIGFLDGPLTPTLNTEVHKHLLSHFVVRNDHWYVNGEPDKPFVVRGKYYPGIHTFTIVLKEDVIDFHVDGRQVGRIPNCKSPKRSFHISADPYTSHYGGRLDVLKIDTGSSS